MADQNYTPPSSDLEDKLHKTHTEYIDALREKDLRMRAINTADMAYDCVNDLGLLFKAINKISSDDKHNLSHDLARIGIYLSADWANMIDCSREETEKPGAQAL